MIPRIKCQKTTLVVDSWDHPVKAPFFITADEVLVWNSYVKDLVNSYQKIGPIKITEILKFRYIQQVEKLELKTIKGDFLRDLENLRNFDKVALYPITLGVSTGLAFEQELLLIQDLANAAKQKGYYIYVKPKPNTSVDDLSSLKTASNLIIGFCSEKKVLLS